MSLEERLWLIERLRGDGVLKESEYAVIRKKLMEELSKHPTKQE